MAATEDNEVFTEVKPFLFVDDSRLLQTSLSKYFNKPLFSDITVIGPDGRKLLCHQVVLSAGSKRFANMLEQGNLANEELPVWGVDSDALQSIIQFFYSGECTLTFPGAVAVMDAANRLDVPSLSAAANTYVREALSVHTATTILARSIQFKLSDLVNTCLGIISDKFDAVAATKDFNTASFETLKRILAHLQSSGKASDESIFRAVWKWTISEPTHPDHFDAALKLIRVPPTISFKELIQSSEQQGISGTPSTAAAAMAAAAAAASSAAQQQQQQQAAAPSGGGEPSKSEPTAAGSQDAGLGATEQLQSQQQQQQGSEGPGTSAAATAAAAPGDTLMVEVPEVKEGLTGPPSSAPNTSQPQGTLSSFDPLSGQPTPTSKALSGPADSAMFGATSAQDMAAAAAAAGMDPMAMDAQYVAMYGSGFTGAQSRGEGAAAAADGSASGAEGGQPVSPSKVQGWGPMGMAAGMQMSGMQMGGMVPGMPGFMPGMPMMGPMGPMMGPMMGMMPGYMSTGRNHAKGVCQVEGCNADLRGLRDYHLRYKICEYHLKVSSIIRDGVHQRFCQQCGRFHPLQDFDGAKRSCRARLLRHNARRRKRGEEELATMSYGNQSAMKRGRGSFSQMPDMEDPATAAAAAAGGYWPMMGMGGSMDPYMAMAMGGYNADGSYNQAAMMQYAQYGMMSPTGTMAPAPAEGSAGAEGEAAAGGSGGKRGGGGAAAAAGGGGNGGGGSAGSDKGKEGGSDGDWDEGEEGEGAGDEDRAHDEVAWAAAGLEMLADVAQARSSAAGDRSRGGSEAGTKGPSPAAGGEGAEGEAKQQADAANNALPAQAQQEDRNSPSHQQQQPAQAESAAHTTAQAQAAAAAAAAVNPCGVAPLQLADSLSPHVASGGLFVGRVSPGHDAPPTEPGTDAATAAAAAGKRGGTPAASGGAGAAAAGCVASAAAGDDRHRLSTAAGASSSPSNDLAFRADKPGAAAGTVKG